MSSRQINRLTISQMTISILENLSDFYKTRSEPPATIRNIETKWYRGDETSMNIGMIILGTAVGGVLLFLWNGFTQNVVPWGIKSVKTPPAPDEEIIGSAIASVTTNGMHLIGKQVTAFLAVRPASFYSAGRYLAVEFLTQVIVALVLTIVLALTVTLPVEQRVLLVVLMSLVGVAAIDLQYWNWWGFSEKYTLGIAISRVIGHTIVGFILINFIVRV